MLRKNNPQVPGAPRQQGFVLVVCLILLLVLTLIGIASVQNTALEEKMAGNDRNRELAFQSAEAALRVGESGLSQGLWSTFAGNTAGLYIVNPLSLAGPIWTTLDWTNPANVGQVGGTLGGATLPGSTIPIVVSQPELIIEQLVPVPAPGQNLGQQQFGNGVPTVQLYRVTALATGGDTNSQVMLQSVYKP